MRLRVGLSAYALLVDTRTVEYLWYFSTSLPIPRDVKLNSKKKKKKKKKEGER